MYLILDFHFCSFLASCWTSSFIHGIGKYPGSRLFHYSSRFCNFRCSFIRTCDIFSGISKDEAFVNEIRSHFRFIASVLLRRAQKVMPQSLCILTVRYLESFTDVTRWYIYFCEWLLIGWFTYIFLHRTDKSLPEASTLLSGNSQERWLFRCYVDIIAINISPVHGLRSV